MFHFQKKHPSSAAPPAPRPAVPQMRDCSAHPFHAIRHYTPLGDMETRLYRSIREAVPIVDAAIYKLIRLTGGFDVSCDNSEAERELRQFLRTVPVGRAQVGIDAFLSGYLDSLLTCGRAVGEILPSADGRDIAAVLCGDVDSVEVLEGASPLDFSLAQRDENGKTVPFPRQNLLLFTPLQPESNHPYGVSLLRSMPFLTDILLKIYEAIGLNWERCGNVRFAINYKPSEAESESGLAVSHAERIADEWSRAMQSSRDGCVRDFVSVGDVSVRVIGAENQIPDSSVPVRSIMEQLIAKTGLPPFVLGLNWSSTERMSAQQADILTTEITAYRRSLTPVLEKICRFYLRIHGYGCRFAIVWDDINLQDEVEEARAALYREQARKLAIENEERQKHGEHQNDMLSALP